MTCLRAYSIEQQRQLEDEDKCRWSPYLMPWEKPRNPFPFPAVGSPCPKCGRIPDVHSDSYLHCFTCGTILHNEEPVYERRVKVGVPRPYQHTVRRKYRELPCHRCGTAVLTNANCKYVYCLDCREIARKENNDKWNKIRREQRRIA